MISTQHQCCVVGAVDHGGPFPKKLLTRHGWRGKSQFLMTIVVAMPILIGKYFSQQALDDMRSTADGVLMSDSPNSLNGFWNLTHACRDSRRIKYNFDDPLDIPDDDYPLLVGVTKVQFDNILSSIKPRLAQ